MGASEWATFVMYQPDVTAAFREAQHLVFRTEFEGRPFRKEAIDELRHYLDEPWFSRMHPDPADQTRTRQWIANRIAELQSLPEPATIDDAIQELLMLRAEEGTGSILDMMGVSSQPDILKVAPLSPAELMGIFGTDKPDHDMIIANQIRVTGFRESPMGSYLVVYKDSIPDEIFFGGFSGD